VPKDATEPRDTYAFCASRRGLRHFGKRRGCLAAKANKELFLFFHF
jgi:hypothetical protein